MSPQRYLADASAAVAAVNEFSDVLTGVGPEARRPALLRVAPDLEGPLDTTTAISERLASATLQDRRLESQRAEVAPALAAVVDAMTLVVGAARDGDPEAAEAASVEFSTAIGELRKVTAGG